MKGVKHSVTTITAPSRDVFTWYLGAAKLCEETECGIRTISISLASGSICGVRPEELEDLGEVISAWAAVRENTGR